MVQSGRNGRVGRGGRSNPISVSNPRECNGPLNRGGKRIGVLHSRTPKMGLNSCGQCSTADFG